MITEKKIKLLYSGQVIEARIVNLTPAMAVEKMTSGWWREDCLKAHFKNEPIDLYWNWNTIQITYDGRSLASEKVAAVTGEGDDLAAWEE